MPYMQRRVVRDAQTGNPRVVFVDSQTGNEVTNTDGYRLLEHGTGFEQFDDYYNPDQDQNETEINTDKDQTEDLAKWFEENRHLWLNGRDEVNTQGEPVERSLENNFGFNSKPGWMSILSMVPGFIGLAGKGINVAMNVSNMAAIQAARQFFGLEPLSPMEMARGAVKGTDGYVGDVEIGGEQVGIGLDQGTKSPAGRHTITPQQATQRAEEIGSQITPVSKEQQEQAEEQASKENNQSFGEKALSKVKGLVGVDDYNPDEDIDPSTIGEETTQVSRGPNPNGTGFAPSRGNNPNTSTTRQDPVVGIPSGTSDSKLPKVTFQLGPKRPFQPKQEIIGVVQQAVNDVLGPDVEIVVSSGTEKNPLGIGNKAQHGSNRHSTGTAMDFAVFGPDGKMITSIDAIKAIGLAAAARGAKGFGAGSKSSYMGQGRMHIDLVDPDPAKGQDNAWGDIGNSIQEQFVEASRNSQQLPQRMAIPPSRQELSPTENLAETPQPMETVAENIIQQSVENAVDENRGSPNQPNVDNMGLVALTQQAIQSLSEAGGVDGVPDVPQTQIEEMAYTIAGELGSETIAGIQSGDPQAMETARQEIAAIASTMDNRARSTRYAGFMNPMTRVLSPQSYNSLMSSNRSTTNDNFGRIGQFVMQALADYYGGSNPSPAPNATHYRNPEIANPSWADYTRSGETTVGQHAFSEVTIPGTNRTEYARGLPQQGPVPQSRPSNPTTSGPTSRSFAEALINEAIQTPNTSTQATPGVGRSTAQVNPVGPQQTTEFTSFSNPSNPQTQTPSTSTGPSNPNTGRPGLAPNEQAIEFSVVSPEEYSRVSQPFGQAVGSGRGMQSRAGLASDPMSPFAGNPMQGVHAGVQAGLTGFSAGSLPGSARSSVFGGIQAPTGPGLSISVGPDESRANQSFSNVGSFSSPATGFGSPGQFGNSAGGGYGSQANAGLGMGIGTFGPDGTMSSTQGMQAAERSFGGFSAGSFPGSAQESVFGGTGASFSGGGSGDGSFSGFSGGGGGSGFGSPGDFGGAEGGGNGSQANAGLGGSNEAAEASFSGTSAGTFSGTATGFGTGLGAAGTGPTSSFSGPSSSETSRGPSSSSPAGGAQAAAGYSDGSRGTGDDGEGEGEGDGSKVLCGYFYRKGKIPSKIYRADLIYSSKYVSRDTQRGYQLWSIPLVNFLEKGNHPLVEKLIFPAVNGWANEMARKVGIIKNTTLLRKILVPTGEIICNLIGKTLRATRINPSYLITKLL